MDCEHNWTEKPFPGLETRWCTRCNDTETEVELATLRAEVERLREVVRKVHALAAIEEQDYRCVRVVENLREIHKLTKEWK